MWQRKQTLFLALAVVLCGLLYLMPLASYEKLGSERMMELRLHALYFDDGGRAPQDLAIPLHWLNAVLALQLIFALFLFRNRERQRRVARLAFLFTLGMVIAFVFTNNAVASAMGTAATVKTTLAPAAYFPIAILVLVMLADRGIRKDEELLRSADRLR